MAAENIQTLHQKSIHNMETTVSQLYGNRIRVRVCGVCRMETGIVMVHHDQLAEGGFWAPPGGGIEFGETAEAALVREFREETGLEVAVGEFLFTCELVKPPLHAVELFFAVSIIGGSLKTGRDPESGDQQIIRNVKVLTAADLDRLKPTQVHGIFRRVPDIAEIERLRGYFKL